MPWLQSSLKYVGILKRFSKEEWDGIPQKSNVAIVLTVHVGTLIRWHCCQLLQFAEATLLLTASSFFILFLIFAVPFLKHPYPCICLCSLCQQTCNPPPPPAPSICSFYPVHCNLCLLVLQGWFIVASVRFTASQLLFLSSHANTGESPRQILSCSPRLCPSRWIMKGGNRVEGQKDPNQNQTCWTLQLNWSFNKVFLSEQVSHTCWKLQQMTPGSYPAKRIRNWLYEHGRLILLTLVVSWNILISICK